MSKSHAPRIAARWDGTQWVIACIWCHRTHRHHRLGEHTAACPDPAGRAYLLTGTRRVSSRPACGYLLAVPEDDELWTAVQAAEWMGYKGPNAAGVARAALRRYSVEPVYPPRAGYRNLYRAAEVRIALTRAPGMGHRSDLRK